MRKALLAALFVAGSVGMMSLPAPAESLSFSLPIVLSFDFSDNSVPASAANGVFNVIADVLPERTGGYVRMVAISPDNSGVSNLVCPFQAVQKSQAECSFNFTTNGVWTVRAQFAQDNKSDVTSVSITRLRVTN